TRTAVQATYAIGGKTATVRGIEALGNGDADRFQSGSGSDVIITRSEQYDDQIATNAGADTVKVAGGNDVVDLGTNAAGSVDTLIVDYAHLNSGAGVNTGIQTGTLADGYGGYFDLGNSSAHSVVFAGAERFDLTLTVWDDVVTTGDGDDVVRGNGGNDYLVTRKGADTIDGGEGADTWAADKSAMTAALDLDLTRTAVQATYVIGGKTATVRGI
ncbi:calcium-binding protein, partial [Methylopila sp. Yamaguchi]|uniref:calcium-binding protein n=1 Tax=Methylopila sp. Yamaguchi TaxID=1437817 RepID=UPI0040381C0E